MSYAIKLKLAGLKMKFWYYQKHVSQDIFPNAKGIWGKMLDDYYEYASMKHHNSSVQYCDLLFNHK